MFPVVVAACLAAPPSPALVDRLGHPDFQTREAAEAAIRLKLAARETYHADPEVVQGLRHTHPEVVHRCRRLLGTDYAARRHRAELLLDAAVRHYYPCIDSFYYDAPRRQMTHLPGPTFANWAPFGRQDLRRVALAAALADYRPDAGGPTPEDHARHGESYPAYRAQSRRLGLDLLVDGGHPLDAVVGMFAAVMPAEVAQMEKMGHARFLPPAVVIKYAAPEEVAAPYYAGDAMAERLALENLIWPW